MALIELKPLVQAYLIMDRSIYIDYMYSLAFLIAFELVSDFKTFFYQQTTQTERRYLTNSKSCNLVLCTAGLYQGLSK